MSKPDILIPSPLRDMIIDGLEPHFTLHKLAEVADEAAFFREVGPRIRGVAAGGEHYALAIIAAVLSFAILRFVHLLQAAPAKASGPTLIDESEEGEGSG